MHIVHKKSTFATVEEATQYPYGLAVLGVMFKGVEVSQGMEKHEIGEFPIGNLIRKLKKSKNGGKSGYLGNLPM